MNISRGDALYQSYKNYPTVSGMAICGCFLKVSGGPTVGIPAVSSREVVTAVVYALRTGWESKRAPPDHWRVGGPRLTTDL